MTPTQLSNCQDPHCKDEEHLEAIDWFTAETLDAVQRAGESTLPFPKAGKSGMKGTPGFNERVKPFKETAYFCHSHDTGSVIINLIKTDFQSTCHLFYCLKIR